MLRIAVGLALSICIVTEAAPSRSPDLGEFMLYCREHRRLNNDLRLAAPKVGAIAFFPTWALDSNQGRFSWASVQRKLSKGFEFETDAYVDKKQDQWIFSHDRSRSFYPARKHIRGIFYRGRIFIIDGHHRALISTYLGADTIPVQIVGDLSERFSPKELGEYLGRKNLSYNRNSRGRATEPVDLCEMVDDPNLELARILLTRVDVQFSRGRLNIENVRGKKWTIGAKTDEDIPFLEFEVADSLRRAGVKWNDDYSDDLGKSKLKKFLRILEASARNSKSRLSEVLLFERPSRVAKMDLHELLLPHLINIGCEQALRERLP